MTGGRAGHALDPEAAAAASAMINLQIQIGLIWLSPRQAERLRVLVAPIPTSPQPRSHKLRMGVSRPDSGGCQSLGPGSRAAATWRSGTTRSSASG